MGLGKRNELLLIVSLIFSVGVHAELQDQGDYVLDTETNNKWMKPTLSRGMTVTQGLEDMTPNRQFAECRYPETDEVNDLIDKLGIQTTGVCGSYCGKVAPASAEVLEDAIRLMGDTKDAYLDASNDTNDVAPDGAGWTRAGYYAYSYSSYPVFLLLEDNELVERATGTPVSDTTDFIYTDETNAGWDGNGGSGQRTSSTTTSGSHAQVSSG